uniref:Ankyrin repeat and SOCS box protein 17 n=1 Tax=Anopheles culicifacies TaxID=139723 RepID=A0A182MST3_9DIPT
MEYVFDVFFEECFNKMERSGLMSRTGRRDIISHLNSVISGCIQGRQTASTQLAVGLAVTSAIDYHNRMKGDNYEVCMMGKYHNVLYIALRISWDWGLEDSNIVRNLLDEIFKCEKTFERLFLGALFGCNAPHFIAGWKSDFNDQDENLRAVVFFLHHSAKARALYPTYSYAYQRLRQTKFIDVPIDSCGKATPLRVALQASAPDIVLILLRHGANPCPDDGGASPVLSLLEKLAESEDRCYPFQLVSCLKLLLRTIIMVELPYKPHLYAVRKEMFHCKYTALLEDGLLPAEQVYGIPSLKHISRCIIRDVLRENFQLPGSIVKLPLPRKLQKYIDLLD